MGDERPDPWPPERIVELLETAAKAGQSEAARALAIEQATATLSPEERAVVARFLEEAITIVQRHATDLEGES